MEGNVGNYARHARRSENPLPHGRPVAPHSRNCTCTFARIAPYLPLQSLSLLLLLSRNPNSMSASLVAQEPQRSLYIYIRSRWTRKQKSRSFLRAKRSGTFYVVDRFNQISDNGRSEDTSQENPRRAFTRPNASEVREQPKRATTKGREFKAKTVELNEGCPGKNTISSGVSQPGSLVVVVVIVIVGERN